MTKTITRDAKSIPNSAQHKAVRITVRDVTMVRTGEMILTGVHVQMIGGQVWAITGPNGSGKTSLLRAIAGLLSLPQGSIEITGGTCYLDGRGWLPQTEVLDGLLWWARLHRPEVTRGQVRAVLESCGLSALALARMGQLSTGQVRQVIFARLALTTAAIWLLDEPFFGLDEAACVRLHTRLEDHRARGGLVVLATPTLPPMLSPLEELSLRDFGRG